MSNIKSLLLVIAMASVLPKSQSMELVGQPGRTNPRDQEKRDTCPQVWNHAGDRRHRLDKSNFRGLVSHVSFARPLFRYHLQ